MRRTGSSSQGRGEGLEVVYSGLADLSAEFHVDSFTEFEQTDAGSWAVARTYPLTGPRR